MYADTEFRPFGKIALLSRDIVISEKLVVLGVITLIRWIVR